MKYKTGLLFLTGVVTVLLIVSLLHALYKVSQLAVTGHKQAKSLISTESLQASELRTVEAALAPSGIPLMLLDYATYGDKDLLQESIRQANEALIALDRIESVAINAAQQLFVGMLRDEFLPILELQGVAEDSSVELSAIVPLHKPQVLRHARFALEALQEQKNLNTETLRQALAVSNREIGRLMRLIWYTSGAILLCVAFLIISLYRLQRIALQAQLNAEEQLRIEQRLHDQEHLNSVLFESLPVPVVTINDRGVIESSNPATSALFGYSREELEGKRVELLMPASYAKQHANFLSNYKQTGERKIIGTGRAVKAIKKSGQQFDVHISVTEFASGGECHFAGIIVDLSEITAKQTELEQAILQANAATEAKDRFLATASHEIRTPLTGIFGMTDMLSDTELTAEQRKLVNTLASSGRQLMIILNDILDAAKLRQGGIELFPQPINIDAILTQLSITFEGLAKRKEIDFHIEADANLRLQWVVADTVRLSQILGNLCSNAIKFTDQGEVRLRLTSKPVNSDQVQINFEVSDTGCGIPADKLGQIGTPFTQLDTAFNRTGGGTGLGLSIASELLRKMDSSLSVRSTLGAGSVFSFSLVLPLDEGLDQPLETSNLTAPVALWQGTPRLLVAEDNPVNRMVIENILGKLPLEYDMVEDGQQLIDHALDFPYDLIISDIQMPVVDGLEATKRLRATPQCEETPIIALTAAAFEDEILQMTQAGFTAYVAKPIHRETLIKLLQQHLNKDSEAASP